MRYGGRYELEGSTEVLALPAEGVEARFQELLDHVDHSAPAGAVDLLIRTGAEKRLSDFLLWQSAYAELYFADCMWPDFDEADMDAAVDEFRHRERRFHGKLRVGPTNQAGPRRQKPLDLLPKILRERSAVSELRRRSGHRRALWLSSCRRSCPSRCRT